MTRLSLAVACALYSRRGYREEIAGTDMYFDPRYRLFRRIKPEAGSLLKLHEMLKPGDTFIEVGANIGIYSITVARAFDGKVKVVAFEAAPHCFAALKKHVAYNHVEDTVRIEEMACGDRAGTLYFDLLELPDSYPPSEEGELLVSGNPDCADPHHLVEVPVITLDEYVEKNELEPDYLQINVNGSELYVLKGARKVIDRYRPVIFCSLNNCYWDEPEAYETEIRSLIEEMGYDIRDVETGGPFKELTDVTPVVLVPRPSDQKKSSD